MALPAQHSGQPDEEEHPLRDLLARRSARENLTDKSSTKPIPIDSTWKLEVELERYETADARLEVRVKTDLREWDEYIDLLVGKKGADPHAHYGVNRGSTIRFPEHRDRIHSIRREVVDSNLGMVDDRILVLRPTGGVRVPTEDLCT